MPTSFEDMLQMDMAKQRTKQRTPSLSVTEDMQKYDLLAQDCELTLQHSPLMFWKDNQAKLPILHDLALNLLVTQASSTPSERLFSAAGLVDSTKRARLAAKTRSMLVFGKVNMHLLH